MSVDRPKILHIGSTNGAHIYGVIAQIAEHTTFDNVILSPTTETYNLAGIFPGVKLYTHDSLDADIRNLSRMKEFVDNVLSIEKPDIIIGHSITDTAVIVHYALSVADVPAMSFIWGSHCCERNLKNNLFKQIFFDNLRVIKKTNFLLTTNIVLTNWCISNYGINRTDLVKTCPPVNLAQYTNHIPDTSNPRLLLGKARCEEYIYASLPATFKQFPNLEVHAFHVEPGITFAKNFGVFNRIKFYSYPLCQEAFSDLIKKVNIVYTVTPDSGTGATAMQASYAGCINLMRRCPTSAGMLDDGKNAIMCNMTSTDVHNKLSYSIQNLGVLCNRFKKNNGGLIQYDQENTWKELHQALLACLDGRKGKIAPTYGV